MNLILGVLSIVITFSLVVLAEKLFKKEGLFVWTSIATITANILVCKSVDILGYTTSLGNVLFASSFLAIDIMSEKYGAKESRKTVILSVFSQIVFLVMLQLALAYQPSEVDLTGESMETLFSLNLRVGISSILMYFISNMLDIYLFEKIKSKIPGKLWLRNNVSTIISNCLENYLFTLMAFAGVYDFRTIIAIATFSSVLEIIIAILDTPFVYLAKKKVYNHVD